MVINENVDISINKRNRKYYREKGYTCNTGDIITINSIDLMPNSKTKIHVLCDYCKKNTKETTMYNRTANNSITNKDTCKNCEQSKLIESTMKKYGVDHAQRLDSVKEKIKETNLNKYGAEYYLSTKECIQKREITNMNKYGVKNIGQLTSVREKIANTIYANGGIRTSAQQIYLCNLYRGLLNYPIGQYHVDIAVLNQMICCEYDGGGHELSVELGTYSKEQFNNKQLIRDKTIKSFGWKIMRIVSMHDYLPCDDILNDIFEKTKQYYDNYPEHSWIEFDIDKSIYRNALHKNGEFFDFGKLRKIKKEMVG